MNKIKNCPFCGSEAKYKEESLVDGYCHYLTGRIQCTNRDCKCSTPQLTIDGYYGSTETPQDVYNI